jgi:hypothetical protein
LPSIFWTSSLIEASSSASVFSYDRGGWSLLNGDEIVFFCDTWALLDCDEVVFSGCKVIFLGGGRADFGGGGGGADFGVVAMELSLVVAVTQVIAMVVAMT